MVCLVITGDSIRFWKEGVWLLYLFGISVLVLWRGKQPCVYVCVCV